MPKRKRNRSKNAAKFDLVDTPVGNFTCSPSAGRVTMGPALGVVALRTGPHPKTFKITEGDLAELERLLPLLISPGPGVHVLEGGEALRVREIVSRVARELGIAPGS